MITNNYNDKHYKNIIRWQIQLLKNGYRIKITRYKIPKII